MSIASICTTTKVNKSTHSPRQLFLPRKQPFTSLWTLSNCPHLIEFIYDIVVDLFSNIHFQIFLKPAEVSIKRYHISKQGSNQNNAEDLSPTTRPMLSSNQLPSHMPTSSLILLKFCNHTDPLTHHNKHLNPNTLNYPFPPTSFTTED